MTSKEDKMGKVMRHTLGAFFFQAEDGIRGRDVTGVQTCALPICEKRYILAPKGLAVGDTVVSGPGADIRIGNAMPLFEIPLGTTVHNVELKIGRGGQLCRSAGTGVQVVAKEGNHVTLRLRSTEMRM